MKNFIKKLFNFKAEAPLADNTDKDTVFIKSVDELDQFLHDITMKQMFDDHKESTSQPLRKIVISKEVWHTKIGDNDIFDLMMDKAMDRAMNDNALKDASDRQIKGDIDTGKRVMSLFKDDNATVH